MIIKLVVCFLSSLLFLFCAGITDMKTYEQIFTAYNPLLDDYKLPSTTCVSEMFCSIRCLRNPMCVSFLFNESTSTCLPFSEYALCEIGENLDSFFTIKGRPQRRICDCNLVYNESFVNVAFGKSVTLSSIYPSSTAFRPEYLTDGNHDTLAISDLQDNPYAIVDLEDSYNIFSFFIANRVDCCPERLRNFKLLVSDNQSVWTECIYYAGQVGIDCTLSTHTPCAGRYVKLVILIRTFLQLREVEVYTLV